VKYFCDYLSSIKKNLIDGTSSHIDLPKSNVIEFESIDNYKVILRPSGTEPKIKIYISVNSTLESIEKYDKINELLDQKIIKIKETLSL
jgi:phosphoglucomutase